MTRDEIMAMDAAQLRLAIAEKRGINVVVRPSGTLVKREEFDLLGSAVFSTLPDWPNDIVSAWDLVDEFPEWSSGKYPSCYRFIGWETRNGELNKVAEEFGQTFQIAACRAWLVWKEGV